MLEQEMTTILKHDEAWPEIRELCLATKEIHQSLFAMQQHTYFGKIVLNYMQKMCKRLIFLNRDLLKPTEHIFESYLQSVAQEITAIKNFANCLAKHKNDILVDFTQWHSPGFFKSKFQLSDLFDGNYMNELGISYFCGDKGINPKPTRLSESTDYNDYSCHLGF